MKKKRDTRNFQNAQRNKKKTQLKESSIQRVQKTTKKSLQNEQKTFTKEKHLILLATFTEENISNLTTYYQYTRQTKANITLLIAGNKRIISKLKGVENKLSFYTSEEKNKEVLLESAIQHIEMTDAYVCILPDHIDLKKIQALTKAFTADRSSPNQEVFVVVPEKLNNSDRLSYFAFNSLITTGLHDLPLGLYLLPVTKLQDICSIFLSVHDNFSRLCILKDQKLSIKPLPIRYNYPYSFGETVKAAQHLFFKRFKDKFIDKPIQTIKTSKNLLNDLIDGHHPVYRLTFFILAVFILIFMPFMSFDFGNTWDEWTAIPYAEDILKYYLSFGQDKKVFDMTQHARNATIHYGAPLDLVAAIIHKFLPLDIYSIRHVVNALTGATAMIITARIAKEMGNWRMAIITILLIFLSPRFFGHSMNNHKDIPFALAYAMSIYYMIRFFKQLPRPEIGTFFWLIFSMGLIINVKIGGLIIIAYFGLFSGLYWLFEIYKFGQKTAFSYFPQYLKYLFIITISSYFLGILFWPYGLEKPFTNPFISLEEFTNFRLLISYELFEAKRTFLQDIPWWYAPKWIGITVPVGVLLGLFLGIFIKSWKKYNLYIYAMLLFTSFFPIIYIIIKNSSLYNGWRQVMFVYVPLAVIAGVGWEALLNYVNNRYFKGAILTAYLLLMIQPAIWMVKNHPNEYVYFNELVGGINGAYKNYETDYWCNATRQAAEWLVKNEPVEKQKTIVASNFEISTSQHYINKLTDSVQMLWARQNQYYKKFWHYAFFGSRGMSKEHIKNSFPPKGTIHVIKADSVPLIAIVKRENDYISKSYLLSSQDKTQEALIYAQKAVEYDSNNTDGLISLALSYLTINDAQNALKVLERTIKIDPTHYLAHGLIGDMYRRFRQYDQAIYYLKEAIRLRINYGSAYHNLARSYGGKKDYTNAVKYFEQAIIYNSSRSAYIYFETGALFWNKAKDFPQQKVNSLQIAINSFNKAIQIDKQFWNAYEYLAKCYQELGDKKTADKYLQDMRKLQGK